jgi:hypothetical protein
VVLPDIYSPTKIFEVRPKEWEIWALSQDITFEKFKELAEVDGRFNRESGDDDNHQESFNDYSHLISGVTEQRLMASRWDVANIDSKLIADLKPSDFTAVDNSRGVFRAVVELGLRNFHNKAKKYHRVFTYAVTPKGGGNFERHNIRNNSSIIVQTNDSATGIGLQNRINAKTLSRKGTIVGWGEASSGSSESTTFGWLITPNQRQISSGGVNIVHQPSQHALSALVSIPSWWSEVTLDVQTSWIESDGIKPHLQDSTNFSVSLPTSYEPLENILLDLHQLGPALMESRLDEVSLIACKPGAIVIPGRRLWRSTMVTLGYQVADEISVLPDMKGIIAIFLTVQNQAGPQESNMTEIRRPVRIWTSQGTIALPERARIGIEGECGHKAQTTRRESQT